MMSNDYSQLPVMNGPNSREIDGVISWKSIGWKVALGVESDTVQDYMSKEFTVLSYEMPILEAVNVVKENKFVLVQKKDKRVSGLVTITDIADEFFTLAEPFLYLGQIETSVRVLLEGKFSKEELEAVRYGNTDREINSISDLSFNQYIQLMLKDDNWEKLQLPLDKGEFTKKLECIRDIRNEVMHFYPDQLDRASRKLEQEQTLRLIANFFKEILSNRVT